MNEREHHVMMIQLDRRETAYLMLAHLTAMALRSAGTAPIMMAAIQMAHTAMRAYDRGFRAFHAEEGKLALHNLMLRLSRGLTTGDPYDLTISRLVAFIQHPDGEDTLSWEEHDDQGEGREPWQSEEG